MGFWIEKSGDLIKRSKLGEFDLISHGCNCQKDFGKGIALTFKKRYPLSYQVDLDTPSPFGGISVCTDYDDVIIINAYTQRRKGKSNGGNDSDFHRYEAIKTSMDEVNSLYPGQHIGLPLIGCGYAGLKWSKVKKVLKESLKDMDVTIIHFD